jgi:hypothetical protein
MLAWRLSNLPSLKKKNWILSVLEFVLELVKVVLIPSRMPEYALPSEVQAESLP